MYLRVPAAPELASVLCSLRLRCKVFTYILVFGQAKIPYFYHFLWEKDVLGLQIPMYNSFAVDASHAVN